MNPEKSVSKVMKTQLAYRIQLKLYLLSL